MQYPASPSSPTAPRALIYGANENMASPLRQLLQQAGWHVESCRTQNDFVALTESQIWLLVVIVHERHASGLVDTLHQLQPQLAAEQTFVVVVAEHMTATEAILCTRHGALDYLGWPVMPSQFLEIAERTRKQKDFATVMKGQRNEGTAEKQLKEERVMIGSSVGMIELSKQLVRLARSPELRVFINGETGTGKEVVARMIHDLSGRSGPFQAVNCAATVESLLESDLFGHEKGSFTGAHATKKGLWEETANGTLFLDEITETSPTVQAKLLRVLQEGVIRRIGSNKEIKVTARVIAASNRDLEQAVREGVFRRDLYYRLGQILRLPPLRERLEDIPLLVEHFCQRASREIVVTPEAMELLCAYEWPGNVRELESVIQQIISFSGHFVFREDVLRHINVTQAEQKNFNLPFWSAMNGLRRGEWPTINEVRNWYVTQAYLYFGKESVVARQLGMDARTVTGILEEVAANDQTLRRITQASKAG